MASLAPSASEEEEVAGARCTISSWRGLMLPAGPNQSPSDLVIN